MESIEIVITSNQLYVPLYHLPSYKVAQILMILEYTTNGKKEASIAHLHTIAWAMRDRKYLKILLDYIDGKRDKLVSWCYEPFLQKAIIIALVKGYCIRLENGNIKLTTKSTKTLTSGIDIIQDIEFNYLFQQQRHILSLIGNSIQATNFTLNAKQNWHTQYQFKVD